MKLDLRQKNTWLYLLLAFLLPVAGMFAVMIIRGFIPFGETSMLYSDMYHQYYPFFVAFRKALLSGESLLYSWDVGLGMDYLGLIAYYLASPLNLLSVLIPESLTLSYFSLLTPIKLGFAGLFFAVFLKGIFRKNDLSISIFGCFYSLCAWALGYHWNVMWLDTFALLPLVILGAVKLLQERKFILYTIALFFSVVANYYIGLFTCIFVALVFFCYEFTCWEGIRKFVNDLGRIALFSVLAIGMTAILELPAYSALQTTYSSVNNFPAGFRLNIADTNTWVGLVDAMRKVAGNMNGGLSPNYKEANALPNIYCGVISTMLSFLFLTSRQVRLREKIVSVFLLVFFMLSFIIRQLDYMWHGFHFTNMIPYRFSFLYSFVVLYMAYRAYLLRDRFKLWQLCAGASFTILILLCGLESQDLAFWLFNGLFIILYLAVLVYPRMVSAINPTMSKQEKHALVKNRRDRRTVSGILLLSVMAMELVMNLTVFGMDFVGTTVSDYPKGTEHAKSMIKYMHERSDSDPFYRAEATQTQTLNDGALNGYHGVTTFTSSADVSTTRFMQALGYGARDNYNRYSYEEASPVSNLFLNLKYLIHRHGQRGDSAYFDDLHHYGNVHLLENNAYLPLGFLTDPQILSVDFETAYSEIDATRGNWNKLMFQNKLFCAATGTNDEVWKQIEGNHFAASAIDATLSSVSQSGSCEYQTVADKGGTVSLKYIANQEGYLCLDLYISLYNSSYSARNRFSVWKNGVELQNDTYSLSQTIGVADVIPGDVIELQVVCNSDEHGYINTHAAVLDEAAFRKGYDILAGSVLELTSFKNTRIEGTVNCNRNGVLYTSIPQNGNWRVLVDGKETDVIAIGNAMVGLLLSEGYHTVTFMYRNQEFLIGSIVSAVSLISFATISLCVYRSRRRKLAK